MLRKHGTALAGFAALVTVFAACEGNSLFAPEDSIASMSVEPASVSIDALGAARQLSTVGRDSTGAAIGAVRVTWTSLNPGVASVDSDGTVTALSVGKALIIASAACCATVDTAVVDVRQVVATVRMTPGSATIKPDSTIVVDAIPRDGRGNPIPGRPITWTSSAPDVAVVDAAGNVRALKAGSTTITATVDDKTGSSALVVANVGSVSPPPPPTSTTPPQGVVWYDDFETGDMSNAKNGYRWGGSGNRVGNAIARSGQHSMRFTYQGDADLCNDAWAEQRFVMGNDLTEVWFEYYVFLPNGSEGLGPALYHRSPKCASKNDPNGIHTNNKFFAVWDSLYNPKDVMALIEYRRDETAVDGDSYLYGLWGTDTRASGRYSHPGSLWQAAFSNQTRGRWLQIRIHVRLADTKQAANGVIQLWADGILKINMQNLDLAPDPGGRRYLRNGYLMGWANSGFNATTNVYIDDFAIHATNPGW